MKRILIFMAVICLLLCGCGTKDATSSKSETNDTQASADVNTETTAPTTDATVQTTTTTAPTEPTPDQAKTVTVYLLEKSVMFDSGYTEYQYDEQYNIQSYTFYNLENEPMYTAYFEDQDANGMAASVRIQWPIEDSNEVYTLTYDADGKLKESSYDEYTGYQYEYNADGNILERREYYEGILQSAVYYEYDGDILQAVYCEDPQGNKIFDGRVENGVVVEVIQYADDVSYSYLYEYDENGNLVSDSFVIDGETMPGTSYSYKAVEVDAHRAKYLTEQQNYLLPIT